MDDNGSNRCGLCREIHGESRYNNWLDLHICTDCYAADLALDEVVIDTRRPARKRRKKS